MISVGIVGCGSIGNVHAVSLKKEKNVKLWGFADIREERARQYRETFTQGEGEVYDSLESMLKNGRPDAIHICTPHVCHVPMAVEALNMGIHVFMEKPPAISRQQFEQLRQAEAKSTGRLGICFQNRYTAAAANVETLLKEGKLGRILGGRGFVTWNRTKPYYAESGWRGTLAMEGGGVLINQAIHTLDLMVRWLGKPLTVDATMCNHHLKDQIEVEDTLEAYLTFSEGENPVRAVFYATNAYGADLPVMIELTGEKGFARLEGDFVWYQTEGMGEPVLWKAPWRIMGGNGDGSGTGTGTGKAYWGSGHEPCIHDFYDSLVNERPFKNNLGSVVNTWDTMMRIYESAGQAHQNRPTGQGGR